MGYCLLISNEHRPLYHLIIFEIELGFSDGFFNPVIPPGLSLLSFVETHFNASLEFKFFNF